MEGTRVRRTEFEKYFCIFLKHRSTSRADAQCRRVQDGTDHGNTQSTVRDALPRHVIMFYYAQDTTLDMGPTSIIPGSQYYSVDRLGAGSSEHSLATELYDNEDEDLARRDAGIQSAGAILSRGFEQVSISHTIPHYLMLSHTISCYLNLMLSHRPKPCGRPELPASYSLSFQGRSCFKKRN
eukprot:SAG31_NODE_127_length_23612_cov_39.709863_6_plen_182_part_00